MSKSALRLISLLCILYPYTLCMAQADVRAVKHDSRIDIIVNDRLFTSYVFSQDEKYPFFFPVNGMSGASVTSMRNSNFPHHSSLFFGCDHVNGGNYWQEGLERGQIISVREDILENNGDRVVIVNECIWSRPGAKSPIRDVRTIIVSVPAANMVQVDFDVELQMLTDVTISRTNHSLFAARMAADLTVNNGGTMINAEGKSGEAETFGEPSGWISYYGERYGKLEGLTIMQHPSNCWYPAPWFTRDYGFISPTPLYWPEDPSTGTKIGKGEVIRLRYRVLVHSGDHKEANIQELYRRYVESD